MSLVQNEPAAASAPADFDPTNPIYFDRAGRPLHPACDTCGWRMGGQDSWDGQRCKCGKRSPSFTELARTWTRAPAQGSAA